MRLGPEPNLEFPSLNFALARSWVLLCAYAQAGFLWCIRSRRLRWEHPWDLVAPEIQLQNSTLFLLRFRERTPSWCRLARRGQCFRFYRIACQGKLVLHFRLISGWGHRWHLNRLGYGLKKLGSLENKIKNFKHLLFNPDELWSFE